MSKSSLTLPIPATLSKDAEKPKNSPQKPLKVKETTQHKVQPKLQKNKSTLKRTNPEKAGEKEEKADEILENMESLQSNIQVQDLFHSFPTQPAFT